MSKHIFILLLALILPLGAANAIDKKKKMSVSTMMFMRKQQAQRAKAHADSTTEQQTVRAFVHIRDKSVKGQLEALGVIIDCDFDEFLTARIPVGRLSDVLELEGVTYVNVEQKVRPACDSARVQTKALDVAANTALAKAAGLTQAYTGKGVIAGVIDEGIDFQHIAFYDKNGNCRIKRAYYNGSFTDRPDTLVNPDPRGDGHGTHTSSTLGGSPVKLNFMTYDVAHAEDILSSNCSGMAPDVEFFLCESDHSDVENVSLLKEISDYADKEGKPCIINCSWGRILDAHDASDETSLAIKKITEKKGHIVVMSAGNEAEENCYAYKQIGEGDSLNLILREFPWAEKDIFTTHSLVFAREADTPLTVQSHIFRVDTIGEGRDTLVFVYDSPVFDYNDDIVDRIKDISQYTKYLNGYLYIVVNYDTRNNKYYVGTALGPFGDEEYDFGGNGKYGVMITVKPQNEGDRLYVDAWSEAGYGYFATDDDFASGCSQYGVTLPTPECTVSTQSVNDSVICVGAYNSKNIILFHGRAYDLSSDYPLGDITWFSSYKLKDVGPPSRALPDVTAPGACVLAAAHRNYVARYPKACDIPNEKYPYISKVGTSLACPVTAGIIAQWLQAAAANGLTLGVQDIRDIIERSADKDQFTTDESGEPVPAFGPNGKINALKGMVEVLKLAAERSAVRAVNTDKPIDHIRYVSLKGLVSNKPFENEVNLKVTRYTDGTESVVKIVQ